MTVERPPPRLKLVPLQTLGDATVAKNQLVREEAASLARLVLQRPFARRRSEAAQELRLNHLATS